MNKAKTIIPLYQVDAFTDKVFGGNPAGVCLLEKWPDDHTLQQIAAENNLPETAFVIKEKEHFSIRWFTPSCEVDLCGHATLASAYVLFNEVGFPGDVLVFQSLNRGELKVSKDGNLLELDFPVDTIEETFLPYGLTDAFNFSHKEVYQGKDDYLIVFANEDQIRKLEPDFEAIASIKARGVICTAPGNEVDFVSRFFGPQSGIDEDPVTGSAHTTLAPYWVKQLNKNIFTARQLSQRGGDLKIKLEGKRVKIAGSAVLYFRGEIYV